MSADFALAFSGPPGPGLTADDEALLNQAIAHSSDAAAIATGASDTIVGVINAVTIGYDSRGEVVADGMWGSGPYNRWFVGADVGTEIVLEEGESLTHFTTNFETYTSDTTKVRLTFLLRDLASAALNTPGQQPGDTVFGPYTFALQDLGLTPGANVLASVRVPIGSAGIPFAAATGKRVYAFPEGLTDGLAGSPIGMGRLSTASGALDQGKRGYYGTASSTVSNAVASPYRLAFGFEQRRLPAPDALAKALSGGGGYRSNCSALRQYRMRRRKLTRPTKEAVQNVIGLWGTSWTQAPTRWSGGFAESVVAEQGMAAAAGRAPASIPPARSPIPMAATSRALSMATSARVSTASPTWAPGLRATPALRRRSMGWRSRRINVARRVRRSVTT